ncbi:hypothetical protein [Bosea beijingensis]|uniref:hypothetical protein n=1 Tax=Bosea beijingensis TaxID=3068632 RepID=UPI0027406DB2|nr:hypothetical protein [Bosea sp. REN20]
MNRTSSSSDGLPAVRKRRTPLAEQTAAHAAFESVGQSSNTVDNPAFTFDFGFGAGRYLRGRGWLGIIALCVVMLTVLAIPMHFGPLAVGSLFKLLR